MSRIHCGSSLILDSSCDDLARDALLGDELSLLVLLDRAGLGDSGLVSGCHRPFSLAPTAVSPTRPVGICAAYASGSRTIRLAARCALDAARRRRRLAARPPDHPGAAASGTRARGVRAGSRSSRIVLLRAARAEARLFARELKRPRGRRPRPPARRHRADARLAATAGSAARGYRLDGRGRTLRIEARTRGWRLLRHAHGAPAASPRTAASPPARARDWSALSRARPDDRQRPRATTARPGSAGDQAAGLPEAQPAPPALLRQPGLSDRELEPPRDRVGAASDQAPGARASLALRAGAAHQRDPRARHARPSRAPRWRAHPELQLARGSHRTALDITLPAARRFARDLILEYLELFRRPLLARGGRRVLASGCERAGGLRPTSINWIDRLVRARGRTLRVWHDGLSGGRACNRERGGRVVGRPRRAHARGGCWPGHRVLNAGWWPTYYVLAARLAHPCTRRCGWPTSRGG